ncbi:54S ribosomal protein subunit img1, mitochondrial [Neolecta irregularis DAH-3]|uniref:54S ribosomal protein subunit img1, mitochondrial n=1 Tax=Neolecta irregularis (strain DAH-3) TaxID=1198029 RepID=A0A1U7LKB9_NEOID|nr:54S ribosomal protein subunit img1, mitochondrial [Neolecta irregularis DAH-3]|eukprot:OLL22971.1 54S ribosomal protein subunit img1, mitochondrial [Neolecta irregularis DAH-3]
MAATSVSHLKVTPRLKRARIPVFPALPAPVPNVINAYHNKQLRVLDPRNERRFLFDRSSASSIRAGAVVQVDYLNYPTKTQSSFTGVIMAIKRRGIETSFRLRNKVSTTGVEIVFPLYSPMVQGIKVLQHSWQKRTRRAKLFYLRKPKHDIKSSIKVSQKPIMSIA